jgi:hypothetical protein
LILEKIGLRNLSKVRLAVFPLGGRVARHRDRPDVPPMLAALTEADRAALTLAIERARAQDVDLAQQIDRMLADTDRIEVGMFAAACCQRKALRLKPWQIPPCRIRAFLPRNVFEGCGY